MNKTPENRSSPGEPIAIVGMAGRFPGAPDVETFWANVRDGVDSIRRLSEEELIAAGVSRAELGDPDYVPACPVLEDIDKFDASFFGFSPRDASVMDPAHRIFLELAWHAVEHAGYTALPDDGPVGVFAGAGAPLYMIENLRSNPDLMRSMGEFLVRHTGNDMNFLATRVSYEMDLRGPSMNVQTACSSALVSVHMACQSLMRGECAMALAGGATVLVPGGQGYVYQDGEILSPDGKCRPFDAKSAGTVFGSGAGVVVLKRLSDALDDGDTIHAVIKGSAINNDGALRVGYLAPGVDGQAAVVNAALASAGVGADTISYIETHGTGTLVGDPIEVEALNEAFRTHTDRRGFCAIGSVKSNIGHLGEAAAAASLIKAVMALKHRQLPPSLGYESPNPAIDFEHSPFFVNDTLRDWRSEAPLRCGVTALGAGGTNCHVILEEAPALLPGEGARSQQLLVLSAKTKSALDLACDNLAGALEADPGLDLADAAYTLSLGRRALAHRRALAAGDRLEAIARLRARDPKQVAADRAAESSPTTVFMFPGGGAQYARMGIELYEEEEVYREAVDACLEIVNPVLGRDLRGLLFAEANEAETATRTLEQPSLSLPALFTTEYAMARQFEAWGVAPQAFIGHSMGEYVAACLSGVMSLEDALRLVMTRGRLFETVEPGAMLSVPMSEAELLALAPKTLSIAAANAPDLTVASGPVAAIEALQAMLAAQEIDCTRIRIDVAAHSAMLEPILAEFRALCRTIRLQPPQIPFVSNVTGGWITAAQASDPEYWVSHLRSTVRFAEGLAAVRTLGEAALLEVGPGRTLCMLAKAQATPFPHAVNCMRHPQEQASDLAYALTSLGRLWACGVEVDWTALYDGQLRNRIPLPAYPFERKSFWVEPKKAAGRAASGELTKRAELDEWFYGLGFAEAPLVRTGREGAGRRWLVIAQAQAPARELAGMLAPDDVKVAFSGRGLAGAGPGAWRFDFDDPEQYVNLLRALEDGDEAPDHVVFLAAPGEPRGRGAAKDGVARNFLHPTYLVQALGGLSKPVQLSIVTSGLCGVDGQEVEPLRALTLGPSFVAPRELDHLQSRCVDTPAKPLDGARARRIAAALVEELRAEAADRLVALRPAGRWVQQVAPLPLPQLAEDADPRAWVREGGVYLITGGLGGIGLEVAGHLARSKPVKLALLSRDGLPDAGGWDEILAKNAASRTARRIAHVRALQALGAQVLLPAADVADAESLGKALDQVRRTFGPLNGVIHAAGVMDDAPLMAKTAQAMGAVLAPKVAGTLALDALVREDLDIFVLFSSVASFLGLPGQVDYTAANAFLDAFARARAQRAAGRTVAINWNAWRDIGMAAAAYRHETVGPEPAFPSVHPALDGYSDEGAERTFAATFSLENAWLLAEHKVKGGQALLPGTAFVELARAAFAEGRKAGAIELSNLTFISPFQAAEGESRRLVLRLTPTADGGVDIAMSDGGEASAAPVVECAARTYPGAPPPALDIAAIAARCRVAEESPADGFLAQDFMDFGPRWANLRRVRRGASEALIELALDDRFASDLGGYGLHPAMLDMATGGVQALIPGFDQAKDFYVPLSYGAVRIFADMPQKVFSHVRCLPGSGQGMAYFDVTLSDVEGRVFAEISSFTMKRLDAGSVLTAPAGGRAAADRTRHSALAVLLREAIAPEEGLQAFDRIMAQPRIVQAVASSVDVELWSRQLQAAKAGRAGEASGAPEGFQRPDLATDYAAPGSPVEAALAAVWSGLLGVSQVGVKDDFFDLGGNSLVAVRLFAAVKKQFGVSLPLATLFEAPTIAGLSALLADRGVPGAAPGAAPAEGDQAAPASGPAWSPLVRIKAGDPARTPTFCVHGAGGNVVAFQPLAQLLPAGSPFYGLQAQGVDGELPFHETIEAMADCYLTAIRAVRPSGPYRLAGYSGGGLVALEMAQRLTHAGEEVELLVFFDSLAPGEARRPVTLIQKLKAISQTKLENLLQFPAQRFQDYLRARRLRLAQTGRDPEAATHLEQVGAAAWDAFWRAQQIYEPPPYKGDVLLYRAVKTGAMFHRAGPTLGWNQVLKGAVSVVHVDAWHDSMFQPPSLAPMAADLARRIAALDQAPGAGSVEASPPGAPRARQLLKVG